MSRKRHFMISLISAVLAGLLVYAVYVMQLKQVEMQQTVEVVVPNQFIEAGTYIEADMVELKSILKASYDKQMLTAVTNVVGMETMVPLGEGEPLLRWKLDRFNLLPRKDQLTFQIPKDYILSLSNGIRAGDQVQIYVSSAEAGSRKLFPNFVTVASVKTAGNIEVDNPQSPNLLYRARGDQEGMYVSRREANGAIEQINLNLTEEEWLAIDEACRTGHNKLVIALSSTMLNEILEGEK